MRIAIDVDSTLHHYWDVLSEISLRRFGIELPYEEQFTWGITRLREDQLALCIEESHSDAKILAGRPYPGAVEAVRRWSEQGHYIHVTSHRSTACASATARWLRDLGMPVDDLCCSYDKVSRCVELEIDVLIDDSPINLAAAIEHGIRTATILHPWNAELCEEEDVVAAGDWPELERKLASVLAQRPASLAGRG
jgi:beta-phosphoglucomutase-like phosphatase (HAD superfamily)